MLYALEGDWWVCVDIMGVSIVSLPPRMTHHWDMMPLHSYIVAHSLFFVLLCFNSLDCAGS